MQDPCGKQIIFTKPFHGQKNIYCWDCHSERNIELLDNITANEIFKCSNRFIFKMCLFHIMALAWRSLRTYLLPTSYIIQTLLNKKVHAYMTLCWIHELITITIDFFPYADFCICHLFLSNKLRVVNMQVWLAS